jgi:glycosyltransferase involved in cell wall biosynthesis
MAVATAVAQARIEPAVAEEGTELTILMPCLNEAETLAICIDKARRFLAGSGVAGEVLIADNGSTDGSQAIAAAHGARVVQVAERGYGSALISGIRAARGRYVIMGDSDDSYDFSALHPFIEKLRDGVPLVMGNRFRGGIMPGAMPPLHRYFGNPVLTGLGKLFFSSPVGDFHCGLRGFDRAAILALDLQSRGMEFASEMVVKATLGGLAIAEVPTVLHPDGRSRPPHLRSWRDGWRHLRFLLLFSPGWLFLYPGYTLIVAGFWMMAWLLPAARVVGPVTLDVHSLLYAAVAMVVGTQSVLFWVFAKLYATRQGLLPEDAAFTRLLRRFSLERGLVAGLVLLVAGIALGAAALGSWGRVGFGPLQVEASMRLVIPSATAVLLAFQLVYGCFFISVLEIRSSRFARGEPRNP